MELPCVGAVRVFEKWALGLCLSPNLSPRLAPGQCAEVAPAAGSGLNRGQAPSALSGEAVLVAGMNGEVVALDARLHEIHRFRAHEGAVNVLQYHGGQIWTGGGDGCLRVWSWPEAQEVVCLRGPKKPVVALWHDPVLGVLAQSHERALYHWRSTDGELAQEPRRIRNVACLDRLEPGQGDGQGQGRDKGQGKQQNKGQNWFGAPKTGPKAGDIGPLAAFDPDTGQFGAPLFADGFAAWSLAPFDATHLLAFGLDQRPWIVDPIARQRTPVPWHSQSGGPRSLVLADGRRLLYGDGKIVCDGAAGDAPIKGLYAAVEWPEGRALFAGADGQVWVCDA